MTDFAILTPCPPDLSAFGVRSIASYLKAQGFSVKVIFYPGSIGKLKHDGSFKYQYADSVLDDTVELVKDCKLVGVSFLTQFFDRAAQLTEVIRKRAKVPVIWGGIHATTCPEQCLEHADFVCVGEGEYPLLEMLTRVKEGRDPRGVPDIHDRGGISTEIPERKLIQLDDLPPFDFGLEDHYCYNEWTDRVEPLSEDTLKHYFPTFEGLGGKLLRIHRTMFSRGCPHLCTYCNNTNLVAMYQGQKFLRWKSWPLAMQQLHEVRRQYPWIDGFHFIDDTFFGQTLKDIESFAEHYKANFDLPFYAQASPNTITPRKMEVLLDAGMVYVEMGIQSANEETKKLFHRQESNNKVIRSAELIADQVRANKMVRPSYHVILDSPWETIDERLNTLNLLLDLPRPYTLALASLMFFPGTELYKRAKKEGLIGHDEMREIYRKPFFIPKPTYVNLLVYLTSLDFMPKGLIRLLAHPEIVALMERPGMETLREALRKGARGGELVYKGLRAIARGDFLRFQKYAFRTE